MEDPALLGLVVRTGNGLHVPREVGCSQAADSGAPAGAGVLYGVGAPSQARPLTCPAPLSPRQVQGRF